jgi:hypothetical protein
MTGSFDGAEVEYYNNIYMTTNSSGGGNQGKLVLASGLFSNLNNNCYYSATASYPGFWKIYGGSNYTSFASWKTEVNSLVAGSESASINANPQFSLPGGYTAGGGPTQFQLASGSPCLGAGQGGVNMGAWDGTVTSIGANWVSYPLPGPL